MSLGIIVDLHTTLALTTNIALLLIYIFVLIYLLTENVAIMENTASLKVARRSPENMWRLDMDNSASAAIARQHKLAS